MGCGVISDRSRAKMRKWFDKWAAEKSKRREKGLGMVEYRDETYVSGWEEVSMLTSVVIVVNCCMLCCSLQSREWSTCNNTVVDLHRLQKFTSSSAAARRVLLRSALSDSQPLHQNSLHRTDECTRPTPRPLTNFQLGINRAQPNHSHTNQCLAMLGLRMSWRNSSLVFCCVLKQPSIVDVTVEDPGF